MSKHYFHDRIAWRFGHFRAPPECFENDPYKFYFMRMKRLPQYKNVDPPIPYTTLDKLNFNQAILFLSNNPSGMCEYLLSQIAQITIEKKEIEEALSKNAKDSYALETRSKYSTRADTDALANEAKKLQDEKSLIEQNNRKLSVRLEILTNLYVDIYVNTLIWKPPSERQQATRQFLDFVSQNKAYISSKTLYQSVAAISDDYLLLDCYLIFDDIPEFCTLALSKVSEDPKCPISLSTIFEKINGADQSLKNLSKEVSTPENITPFANEGEKKIQIQETDSLFKIFSQFPNYFWSTLLSIWQKAEIPNIQSIYPIILSIAFTNSYPKDCQPLLEKVLERALKSMVLTTSPYIISFLQLVCIQQDQKMFDEILKHPYFRNVPDDETNHDYLLRWLTKRKQYRFASLICAELKDRHELGISISLQDGIPSTLSLLNDVLNVSVNEARKELHNHQWGKQTKEKVKEKAEETLIEDLRECWLRALRYQPMNSEEKEQWKLLLESSISSGVVALDDVFPLMPKDVGAQSFQGTIMKSINEYQEKGAENKNKISTFMKRAGDLRSLIAEKPNTLVELDSLTYCEICKLPIWREQFVAFPCKHSIHIRCLLSNMTNYWDVTKCLNLISLASASTRKGFKALNTLGYEITKSCPICGELSCETLEKKFLLPQDNKERSMWELPEE